MRAVTAVTGLGSHHPSALAARLLRQVLTEHAHERLASIQDTDSSVVESIDPADRRQFEQLVGIDAALHRLHANQPRQALVFECRYFGGLDDAQIAQALGMPQRTVRRDWDAGRVWLTRELIGRQTTH